MCDNRSRPRVNKPSVNLFAFIIQVTSLKFPRHLLGLVVVVGGGCSSIFLSEQEV